MFLRWCACVDAVHCVSCYVSNAVHEPSINLPLLLLLGMFTTYHRITFFNIRIFLPMRGQSYHINWLKMTHFFFFILSCVSHPKYTSRRTHKHKHKHTYSVCFRCAVALWLNKILYPIVVVSWCSFNFCCFWSRSKIEDNHNSEIGWADEERGWGRKKRCSNEFRILM